MDIITIQDSFEEVIADVLSGKIKEENIWIARRRAANDDHQELYDFLVKLDPTGGVVFVPAKASGSVQFDKAGAHTYVLTIIRDAVASKYTLVSPTSVISMPKAGLMSCAISPNGKYLVFGDEAGAVHVYDAVSRTLLKKVDNAHLAGVKQLAVLPSSKALLSVGEDYQTKLWSIPPASDEATRIFAEQKGQLTDLSFIGKGRNFVTSSVDGTVNLWECLTGTVVSRFTRIGSETDKAMCVALSTTSHMDDILVGGDLLFECAGVVLYVGYELGVIQQFSVAGHYQTSVKLQNNTSVTCLAAAGEYLIAGFADGKLKIWNTKDFAQTWELQLSPHYAVSHLELEQASDRVSMLVANGPEMLLRTEFDGSDFAVNYLVGGEEMFKAMLLASVNGTSIVTTATKVLEYIV